MFDVTTRRGNGVHHKQANKASNLTHEHERVSMTTQHVHFFIHRAARRRAAVLRHRCLWKQAKRSLDANVLGSATAPPTAATSAAAAATAAPTAATILLRRQREGTGLDNLGLDAVVRRTAFRSEGLLVAIMTLLRWRLVRLD